MSATFISANVIKHNNTVFLDTDLVTYGDIQIVPTPGSGGRPDGEYWAVPITDGGVVDGFDFVPYGPQNPIKPSTQSFRVLRLVTSKDYGKSDYWYIVGTEANYVASSQAAECCDAPIPMPLSVPPLAPTQLMCQYNNPTDMDYFAVWGVPTLEYGDSGYWAYGYFNDTALSPLFVNGATPAALVSAMQSAWGSTVGGTFTLVGGIVIVLTQSNGQGTDEISINIFTPVTSS